ncbi:amyloid-beta A4 precursor protein-binding family A member 2 [Macrotis lagotis]|uniref:amyloid-beta A4 precursor protein-binding family A member 2 n=1 Tax=Macrotis lagotis TaxID=92651 RepID=UPI003D68DE57
MANRKHQSTTSNMLDHRARSCPTSSHNKESKGEETDLSLEEYAPKDVELATIRQGSPTPVEHECNDNSGDGDSSSDYVNNTSEEEDYDEGLPEEEEGITYYIRYCPEDDSYLEGMDCNGEEYIPHDEHNVETDECQEAVEEWTESKIQHHDGNDEEDRQEYPESHVQILEDEASSLEIQDQEGSVQYCPSEESYQDYYPAEANGNSGGTSPYHLRKEDADLEEQEEDIDQIVAEIKMSMSMSSINSTGEMSPEHAGMENVPNDYKETCSQEEVDQCASRHEGRPKSLNLPPTSKHAGDAQRGFKTKARTPEERQKWPQEQVCNSLEQPRKQQRSDLNGPVDNNNMQETKKVASFPSFVAVPGPCEPEDLIDGIIFAANYLGSTQLLSERNPSKNIRMMQAQEAVSRVKVALVSELGLKNQTQVKLNIVSCPPVTTVLIKRPDLKYQLGFSVQNGIICSLMRGGIAERGGVRVGHRIIEINGQSVVATAHEKIVQALSNSVGEIHMKTMPAAMFRLLTGQETPLYI